MRFNIAENSLLVYNCAPTSYLPDADKSHLICKNVKQKTLWSFAKRNTFTTINDNFNKTIK